MQPINPYLLSAEKISFDKKFFSQSGQKTACKKLKIVNYVPPKSRPNLKEENWSEIEDALSSLLIDNDLTTKDYSLPDKIKFQHLNKLVHDIVRLGTDDCADIHKRLKAKFEEYVDQTVKTKLLEAAQRSVDSFPDSGSSDDSPDSMEIGGDENESAEDRKETSIVVGREFLRIFYHCWHYYLWQTRIVRNIFMVLDRDYILAIPQLCPLTDMCIDIFRSCIHNNKLIHEQLLKVLLLLIEENRKSSLSSPLALYTEDIKSIVTSLFEMSLYKELFEAKFLQSSRLYYHSQTYNKFLERFPKPENLEDQPKVSAICEYLKFIQQTIENEISRISAWSIDQHSTGKILVQIIEFELLATQLQQIVDLKEFQSLFDSNSHSPDLDRAFTLFSRVKNGQKILAECYGKYIRTNGKRIVQKSYSNAGKDCCLIDDLLEIVIRMEFLLKESFSSSELYRQEMRSSFKSFINMRTSKIPAMLAKYISNAFQEVLPDGPVPQEFADIVDRSLLLFDLIYAKEIFEAFFQRDLAKRLLSGLPYNLEAEKMFIAKFSNHSDSNFGTRLEGMFKDIDNSQELSAGLGEHLKQLHIDSGSKQQVDMSISMLTKCHWNTTQHLEFQLPPIFEYYQRNFTEYYSKRNPKRKLIWQPAFSHCVVDAVLHCGKKELHASYLQTLIVLLFNDHPQLTFQEMANRLLVQGEQKKGAEDCVLRMTVQSLIFGDYKLLKKSTDAWEVLNDDLISLNELFTSDEKVLKITQIQWKEMEEKNNIVINQTGEDNRCTVLDCNIVRIMKKEKTLSKQLLVTEIYKGIDFPASSIEINARIENLVERYFLKKDLKTPEVLHYVT